ncbi:MAG: leucine-rich repeat domain-containing protein [Candidatus Lokiarchaeota archaeon]|nr:leucine-rich repeat domain-containing protein [Candidatus Harpocratesius repetitus]
MFNNPQRNLRQIRSSEEKRVIKSIMEMIEQNFGFNYIVVDGHVVEVQLISAGIAIIPRQLKYLPYLKKLQLPSNHLKKLRNLDGCKTLNMLNLHDNRLTNATLRPLEALTQLKVLDLSQNEIEGWENIDHLYSLESLILEDNLIKNIPALDLPQLKILDLRGNPISKLENLHLFENLVDLRLDASKLSEKEQKAYEQGIEAIKDYCSSH